MRCTQTETTTEVTTAHEPLLQELPLDRDEQSVVFWRQPHPGLARAIARHNQRIGTWHQRFLARALCVYILGILAYLVLRILFRVRVDGREHLHGRKKAIFAMRHFFEWDPPVGYWMMLCPRGFVAPHLFPVSLAGHYWSKTPGRRLLSYLINVMGFVRGDGPRQGAIRRSSELLRDMRRCYITIFPTGPIGRKKDYEVRPGIGHLACLQPDVPVIPISVVGIQELRWRDLLLLRRPKLVYRIGEPITAREVHADDDDVRVEAICEHVGRVWGRDEARIRESLGHPASANARNTGTPARARGR
jgi:1-acyl-sn-glycerol-3-phosphate acyltransferase